MLIPNRRYNAGEFVPPYIMPFQSIPVYAEFTDGSVSVCAYNHFGRNWIYFETQAPVENDKIVETWYGPVAGYENQ